MDQRSARGNQASKKRRMFDGSHGLVALGAIILVSCTLSVEALAAGAFDFMDPCIDAQNKFHSTTDAIHARIDAAYSQLNSWRDHPETIPPDVLNHYRQAVRALAFSTWKASASGMALIKIWKLTDPEKIKAKYFAEIYPKDVTPAEEVKLAQALFQRDYVENIRPKMDKDTADVNNTINSQRQKLDSSCSPSVFNQVMRATIGNAAALVSANFNRSKNEKGEIAKLTMAVSGISITDIMHYGLAGGAGSEARKLHDTWTNALDNAGIGPNNEIRKALAGLDPTNQNVPKQLQFNVDQGSAQNACRNATFGLACH